MPVLSIAERRGHNELAAEAGDTESDSPGALDVSQRLSDAAEEFVAGLIYADRDVTIDWALLSPILSTVSAVLTTAFAVERWL